MFSWEHPALRREAWGSRLMFSPQESSLVVAPQEEMNVAEKKLTMTSKSMMREGPKVAEVVIFGNNLSQVELSVLRHQQWWRRMRQPSASLDESPWALCSVISEACIVRADAVAAMMKTRGSLLPGLTGAVGFEASCCRSEESREPAVLPENSWEDAAEPFSQEEEGEAE